MPTIYVEEAFKFAEGGNHVITVPQGEQEVSERCAEVALAKGWAKSSDGDSGDNGNEAVKLEELKNDDLKAMLDELKIEYTSNANKAKLIELIEEAKKAAGAKESE